MLACLSADTAVGQAFRSGPPFLMIMIIAKIMKQSIKIGRDTSGRITVAFSYNPTHVAKVKTIEGYKWHPKEKYWSFPYSETILEKILSVFDREDIHIDPALQVSIHPKADTLGLIRKL